jgi:hypothetical protein
MPPKKSLLLCFLSPALKTLIAWRTGKPCPSKVKGKDKFIKVWNKAKKVPAPTSEVWIEADEQALVELEETAELKGTIALDNAGWPVSVSIVACTLQPSAPDLQSLKARLRWMTLSVAGWPVSVSTSAWPLQPT